jgi:hypothetical protein
MTKDNSPYFLRLELIKIAKDILLEDYQNSKLAKENDYYAQREINDRKGMPVAPFPIIPFTVTQEAIIKLATALNGFVSKQ